MRLAIGPKPQEESTMPIRNFLAVCLAAAISIVCYQRAAHNRYVGAVAEAMGQIDANFVEPIDRRELFEGAMRGMTGQLDEYSSYVDPKQFERLTEELDQEFGGVGIIVDLDEDTQRLMVLSPFAGTPAYNAGIRAGDLIMAVDGTDTEGLTSEDMIQLIRGRPGTTVNLTILPYRQETAREVPLVRDIIPVENVLGDRRRMDGSWDYVLHDEPRVGYIRLTSFGENSATNLASAIDSILGSVDGVILDLRNNPGGLLDAAIAICDLFVDDGIIVSVKGRSRTPVREFIASKKTLVPQDLPVAVLINHYSASASEIVAACLQDYHRAVVIGERSWGKGTVQELYEMEGGRSGLRLTTATYWRPSGRNIHRLAKSKEDDPWGVSPDKGYDVVLDEDEFVAVMRDRRQRDAVVTRSGNTSLATDPSSTADTQDNSPDAAVPEEESTDEPTKSDSETRSDSMPAGESEKETDVDSDTDADSEPVIDRQLMRAIEYIRAQAVGAPSIPAAA